MGRLLEEENGQYCLDCRNALWVMGDLHEKYSILQNTLTDVDFMFEDEKNMHLVEYKNASISGASNPDAFQPAEEKKLLNVSRKFYDSLHFLNIVGKNKPRKYVYVLEYPNGDVVSRKMIRNKLKSRLPFEIQKEGEALIDSVEVLSIKEWNTHEIYHNFPLIKKSEVPVGKPENGLNDTEDGLQNS